MANIKVMKQNALEKADQSRLMQIATHFSNLIKVSETVTVRKEAGRALLDITGRMTMDKRNELMLELFNGLVSDVSPSTYMITASSLKTEDMRSLTRKPV